MAEILRKKFRLQNPYKPDESMEQEVIVSDSPVYDYSQCDWVAIDTEFLNLRLEHSLLCVVQIASPDVESGDPTHQRVEVIYVREKIVKGETSELKEFFKSLLERDNLEIIMHVATADLTRIEMFAESRLQGKLFDTKVAGKISMTNTDRHNMATLIQMLVDPRFQQDKQQTSTNWDLSPMMWNDRAIEYTMQDVIYLHPLKNRLMETAERRGVKQLVEDAMIAMPKVCQLYKYGLDAKVFEY